jgi:hypothetical protein
VRGSREASILGIERGGMKIQRCAGREANDFGQATRVVVMTVADDDCIKVVEIGSEQSCVLDESRTLSGVEEHPRALYLEQQRKAMFGSKPFSRRRIVHQHRDA